MRSRLHWKSAEGGMESWFKSKNCVNCVSSPLFHIVSKERQSEWKEKWRITHDRHLVDKGTFRSAALCCVTTTVLVPRLFRSLVPLLPLLHEARIASRGTVLEVVAYVRLVAGYVSRIPPSNWGEAKELQEFRGQRANDWWKLRELHLYRSLNPLSPLSLFVLRLSCESKNGSALSGGRHASTTTVAGGWTRSSSARQRVRILASYPYYVIVRHNLHPENMRKKER